MRGLLEITSRCIPQLTPYAATRAHHPLKLYVYTQELISTEIPSFLDLFVHGMI